jgi:hypothetical protein
MPIPKNVLDAIERNDREALSRMGRVGGRAAQRTRQRQKLMREIKLSKQLLEVRIQANEHIIDSNGDEGPYPDGVIETLF